jgi:hypothetical protein
VKERASNPRPRHFDAGREQHHVGAEKKLFLSMIHLARIDELLDVPRKTRLFSVLWGSSLLALLAGTRVLANEVAAALSASLRRCTSNTDGEVIA